MNISTRRFFGKAATIFSSIALFVGLSQSASAQKTSEVVATIGSKKITMDELNKKFAEISAMTLLNSPSKSDLLEDLVRFELGVQEAKKQGLDKDPLALERFNQGLYKLLVEKELGKKVQEIKVSEEEMKAWYAKNPSVRTSHILFEVKPGATAEQRAEAKNRATKILEEVRSSKRPFEELVKLYSDEPIGKQTGGDIGWQSRVSLVPAYYEATASMKIGEIKSTLIETPFGFHIIKLTGRQSFEDADRKVIRAAVFDEKRKKEFDAYFAKLRKTTPVKVNSNLIK